MEQPSNTFGEAASNLGETANAIAKLLWTLTGKSIARLAIVFFAVFIASTAGTLLLIAFAFADSTGWTRAGVAIVAIALITPIACVTAFNFTVYRVLRDLVEQLQVGALLSQAFVTTLAGEETKTIPLPSLNAVLKRFTTEVHQQMADEYRGLPGWFARQADRVLLFATQIVIQRIASGCVVNDEVDLDRFGEAIGHQVDNLVIDYLRSVLWDLTRVVMSVAFLLLWIVLYLLSYLI
ncbi:MAG: hypothetical protein AAGF84_08640 [Planctomycetota bacterium]